MECNASILREHNRFSIAYHPDGDGYGTINIFLNNLPEADVRLYSVDNSRRDFNETQYAALQEDIAQGFCVLYLDLTPSNIEQLEEILGQTRLFYIDHHQMIPAFKTLFDRVYAHNPRLYDPERSELYAAGLQVYHLFGHQQADLPYLLISLYGDAKFDSWPEFHEVLKPHQAALSEMANALSIVGLTKPLGPYRPERTDALFEEVITKTRAAYAQSDTQGLLDAFHATRLYEEFFKLEKKIASYAGQVEAQIHAQERLIHIQDDDYALCAMLLKDAYNKLDFTGPYILYQEDAETDTVSYAVMAKNSAYDCAGTIRESPHVTGGGHTDRAGATGPRAALDQALDFFMRANSS